MFITLLIFNFLVSAATCAVVVWIFKKPVEQIFHRLVNEDIYQAWSKYILFAIFVTGISGGVRIWELEKYLATNRAESSYMVELTTERWTLEIYRSIIGTLESNAWLLLVIFLFSLIAFIIVRVSESKKNDELERMNALMEMKKRESELKKE